MRIVRRNEKPDSELMPGIIRRDMMSISSNEILILTLEPGTSLKPHDMPVQVVFFVIKGTGIFHYQDNVAEVNPGDMIEIVPGSLRYWENQGTERLELLVVKVRREEDGKAS